MSRRCCTNWTRKATELCAPCTTALCRNAAGGSPSHSGRASGERTSTMTKSTCLLSRAYVLRLVCGVWWSHTSGSRSHVQAYRIGVASPLLNLRRHKSKTGKKGKAKKGGASVRAAAASSASSQMKPLPLPAGVKEAESSVVTMRDDNGNAVYELGQCPCMLGVWRVLEADLATPAQHVFAGRTGMRTKTCPSLSSGTSSLCQPKHPRHSIRMASRQVVFAWRRKPPRTLRTPTSTSWCVCMTFPSAARSSQGFVSLFLCATQVFMVTGCQPRSLEVEIGHKHFMLSAGDHFVVPSRTVYALRNHSPTESCDIGFFIMKHPPPPGM